MTQTYTAPKKYASAHPRDYKVDLSRHLGICETNYWQLLKLLPGLRDNVRNWSFSAGVTEGGNDAEALHHVAITRLELAPYTSTVKIEQHYAMLNSPSIVIRLYHDAELAEIVSWDGHRHWQPHYDYPNEKMYQPDEKLALNRFLADWLAFCHSHGFANKQKCDEILLSIK